MKAEPVGGISGGATPSQPPPTLSWPPPTLHIPGGSCPHARGPFTTSPQSIPAVLRGVGVLGDPPHPSTREELAGAPGSPPCLCAGQVALALCDHGCCFSQLFPKRRLAGREGLWRSEAPSHAGDEISAAANDPLFAEVPWTPCSRLAAAPTLLIKTQRGSYRRVMALILSPNGPSAGLVTSSPWVF